MIKNWSKLIVEWHGLNLHDIGNLNLGLVQADQAWFSDEIDGERELLLFITGSFFIK